MNLSIFRLVYQALPLVFDLTSEELGHIVIVVSPLISLMDDPVSHLKELGLTAANISSLIRIMKVLDTCVLYHGVTLSHIDAHMKSFIKTEECRRKTLLNHFESVSLYPEQPHLCCDNCATQCKCGMPHNITKYPVTACKDTLPKSKEREVLQQQKKVVEDNLIKYHKSIIMQLVGTTANGNVKTLTNVQFMLGFSQHQISQVLDNLHRIFSTADVYNLVEIWDRRHAQRILSIVSNVFQDINVNSDSLVAVNDTDNYEFDDKLLDEWHEFLQDDELLR